MKLSDFHKYGEELEQRLRLSTFPLAIKVLKKGEDIPEGVQRPRKDLGEQMALCHAFATSRREGTPLATFKEDMLCFEPVVGYGIEEPPELFLQGHNRYPLDVMSLEAGANYAQEFPRLEYGNIGVLSAPLAATPFEPDVVMIYCNSEQLSLLLLARECQDGRNLPCNLSSHAACVYGVVPVIQSGQYHVAIPCRGDRYFFAMAGPDEFIFTVSRARLAELIKGLRHVSKSGSRLPKEYGKGPAGDKSNYEKIGRMLGMDI
jgi:uncharacterized protein (DUF169 family)